MNPNSAAVPQVRIGAVAAQLASPKHHALADAQEYNEECSFLNCCGVFVRGVVNLRFSAGAVLSYDHGGFRSAKPIRMEDCMNLSSHLTVEPGHKARLAHRNPNATPSIRNRAAAEQELEKNIARLSDLQFLLYAEAKHAVLIVFQAMDAGGKDGTIRHVMSSLNPQGTTVTPFKVPTAEERKHDFLWRIHKATPRLGEFAVFNRSHYEDVLVVRVHKLVPKSVWSERYDRINAFEKMLAENNVKIFKFFLHISKEEQKSRFEKRLKDPSRQWKISEADFSERAYWDDYLEAYEDALTRCSTPWAPWYVIPANKKWYRNLAVSQILVEALEGLKMKFPPPSIDVSKFKLK
jgi:PPK2 family polyphosphate:nucleotide phosphotransferase